MIGVMGSAVFPGRIGEPARVVVLSRRLEGSTTRLAPVIAGTVFSQTLINILALAILGAVTFTSVPVFHDHLLAAIIALAIPLAALLLMLAAPRLLRYARRWPSLRVMAVANTLAAVLRLVRDGLLVFTRPRHGIPAVAAQLLAWALQWLACYAVLLALGLQGQAGPVAAAAILLAINLSAVLPVTPSNVGLFQAACLVVLAAFGVAPGPALAYGLVLQAVEVLTALGLGVPALLREGMRWGDIRASAHAEEEPQA
jgi:phosphatidylinositol alpha-mannosyltransferase